MSGYSSAPGVHRVFGGIRSVVVDPRQRIDKLPEGPYPPGNQPHVRSNVSSLASPRHRRHRDRLEGVSGNRATGFVARFERSDRRRHRGRGRRGFVRRLATGFGPGFPGFDPDLRAERSDRRPSSLGALCRIEGPGRGARRHADRRRPASAARIGEGARTRDRAVPGDRGFRPLLRPGHPHPGGGHAVRNEGRLPLQRGTRREAAGRGVPSRASHVDGARRLGCGVVPGGPRFARVQGHAPRRHALRVCVSRGPRFRGLQVPSSHHRVRAAEPPGPGLRRGGRALAVRGSLPPRPGRLRPGPCRLADA